MFFVERLRQIGQVVAAFIDSIAAIAAGTIGAAANRVEQTMAGLLTLVISFLARIAGLGKVSDAVVGVVKKIRAPIDKALDKVVEWIVTMAKKVGKLFGGGGGGGERRAGSPNSDSITRQIVLNGVQHTIEAVGERGRLQVLMASRKEGLRAKLSREAMTWTASQAPEVRTNAQLLATRLAAVERREEVLASTYVAAGDDARRHELAVAGVTEIGQMLIAIANEFGITIEDEASVRATSYHGSSLSLGRGTYVYADPLSIVSLRPGGPRAQFAPGGFLRFNGRNRYAAGHLLADTFGGPTDAANLALISRKTNGRFSSVESRVRNALRGTKKLQEPRTVLRYEVGCGFPANGPSRLESWMLERVGPLAPGARFDGAGKRIFDKLAQQHLSRDDIAQALGLTAEQARAQLSIKIEDEIHAKAASLYLPSDFTIVVTVRAGRGVSVAGDSFPNHIDGGAFPA